MEDNNISKKNKAGKRKRTRLGGYSFLVCIIAAAIVIIINMIVGSFPSTVTKLDISDEGLYTISEETEKIVSAVNEDITVYYLKGASISEEAQMMLDLLDRYKAINSHISVQTVDPVLKPTFYTKYTDTTPSENSLIFESAKRYKLVDFSNILVTSQSFDYSTYSYVTNYSFAGESAITSAIEYVTSNDLTTVYAVSGNGEANMSEALTSALSTDNINYSTVSLMNGEGGVPNDADCVIIYSPSYDLTEEEIEYLNSYMENGGKLILVTSYSASLPNIEAFTESHGLTWADGVVFETSQSYFYQYPYYLLPQITKNDITSLLTSANINILMPASHGILKSENSDGVTIESLLSSSESSFLKNDPENSSTFEKEDGDTEGSFMIGARSTDSETGGQLIWFSSPYIAQNSAGNLEYFIALINSVCEKEASVTIAAKTLMSEALVVPEASANLLMIVMCVVIPIAIMVLGLLIWNYRRKR